MAAVDEVTVRVDDGEPEGEVRIGNLVDRTRSAGRADRDTASYESRLDEDVEGVLDALVGVGGDLTGARPVSTDGGEHARIPTDVGELLAQNAGGVV